MPHANHCPPKHPASTSYLLAPLQQIEVVQLIPVLQDIPLDLRLIDPSDKVLHIPRDQIRRIRDNLRPDPNMALLNELDSL